MGDRSQTNCKGQEEAAVVSQSIEREITELRRTKRVDELYEVLDLVMQAILEIRREQQRAIDAAWGKSG